MVKVSNNWPYLIVSLRSKAYTSIEEICTDVQTLMAITKFNLKRNHSSNNKKAITFVCSCISRKKGKKFEYQDDSDPPEETLEFDNTEAQGSLQGSRRSRKVSRRKVKRSNLHACRFRLKFKFDERMGVFKLKADSKLTHNHQPEDNSSVKVIKASNFLILFFLLILHTELLIFFLIKK